MGSNISASRSLSINPQFVFSAHPFDCGNTENLLNKVGRFGPRRSTRLTLTRLCGNNSDNRRAHDLSLGIIEEEGFVPAAERDSAFRNLACVSDAASTTTPGHQKEFIYFLRTHEQDSTMPSPLHSIVVKKAKPGLLRALTHVWALWP